MLDLPWAADVAAAQERERAQAFALLGEFESVVATLEEKRAIIQSKSQEERKG
jgi:hypothetical protein